jgi:hypothetical protein
MNGIFAITVVARGEQDTGARRKGRTTFERQEQLVLQTVTMCRTPIKYGRQKFGEPLIGPIGPRFF